jgi:4'-phosphopantetheinyl transferase
LDSRDSPLVSGAPGDGNSIRSGEVHLWCTSLEGSQESLNSYSRLLSREEIARASKYVFRRDQTHFILSRGILRELLGRYLSVPGESIEISSAAAGKPELAQKVQNVDLRFNLSHSHGLAIFAFSIARELGIDAEFIREDVETDEIARRYFSNVEREELSSLKDADRAKGFFLCWTRKEAYVKARGKGLEIPLDSFSVTLTPGAQPRLTSEDAVRWSLHSLELATGWASALVVEGTPARIVVSEHSTTTGQQPGTSSKRP